METRIETVECWVLRAPIARARRQRVRRDDQPARGVPARHGERRRVGLGRGVQQLSAGRRRASRAARRQHLRADAHRRACRRSRGRVRALLERRTRQMAIQCGEPGPFAQITGAVDQALWDMAARRAGVPLWKHLGGSPRVRVYASGIGPERVAEVAIAKRAEGYRAFKLKVGFGAGARRRQPRRHARRAWR